MLGQARPEGKPVSRANQPRLDLAWLTIDRSTLPVDRGPHVSDTETLDPHVRRRRHDDVVLTSAGPTCHPQFSSDDAMLTSC